MICSRFILLLVVFPLCMILLHALSGSQSVAAYVHGDLFVVTNDGNPVAQVVVGDSSSSTERYAADELKYVIEKMSGAILPVDTHLNADFDYNIVIGTPQSSSLIEAAQLFESGHDEEIRIRRQENTLYIAGPTPRAALYATYTFIQDILGVRWFWPGISGEYIPSKSSVVVDDLDIRHIPSIDVRTLAINAPHFDFATMVWMARNRLNRHHTRPSAGHTEALKTRGFQVGIAGHNATLPRSVLDQHPEYIAEYGGTRQIPAGRTTAHLDWSNEGAQKAMAEEIGTWWDDNPELDVISFYGPDHQFYCDSADCIAFAPDTSTRWQKFSKAVIGHLEQSHPGRKYQTLAYQGYRPVPTDVAPFDMIGYTTYDTNYTKPMTHSSNSVVREAIENWAKLGTPMAIRGYHAIIFSERIYVPQSSLIMEEIAWAHDVGLKGWWTEVTPFGWPVSTLSQPEDQNWVTNRMALYAAAQSMWNANLSSEQLIRDWADHVFGPAGEAMNRYYKLMEDAWRSSPMAISNFRNPAAAFVENFVSFGLLHAADMYFQTARRALNLAGDESIRERIASQIELEATMLNKWRETFLIQQGLIERFEAFVPISPRQPMMNAQSDDPIWENAVKIPGFIDNKGDDADEKTQAFMMWDDRALYIRFVMENSADRRISDVGVNGTIFDDDAIEIFLDDPVGLRNYYHLVVNASGEKYSVLLDAFMNATEVSDLEWDARVAIGNKQRIVDVMLPFTSFGKSVQPGTTWKVSFSRSGMGHRHNTGWPDASCHNPDAFATLTLIEEIPERKRVAVYDVSGRGDESRADALRTAFTRLDFTAIQVKTEHQLTDVLSDGIDVVVLRHPSGSSLSQSFVGQTLKPFVSGGGMLLIAATGQLPIATWFGDDVAVEWGGSGIHRDRRTTWSDHGMWQRRPHALQSVIQGRITPSSAYRPLSDKWEILAKLPMNNGEDLPYLMRQSIGDGLLVLTSSNFGYGGGHEMFGNLNTNNAAMLLENLLSEHRGQ